LVSGCSCLFVPATPTPAISTLSLHDALPISLLAGGPAGVVRHGRRTPPAVCGAALPAGSPVQLAQRNADRGATLAGAGTAATTPRPARTGGLGNGPDSTRCIPRQPPRGRAATGRHPRQSACHRRP